MILKITLLVLTMLKIVIHFYMMKANFNTFTVPRERKIEHTEKYFPTA